MNTVLAGLIREAQTRRIGRRRPASGAPDGLGRAQRSTTARIAGPRQLRRTGKDRSPREVREAWRDASRSVARLVITGCCP